MKSTARRLGYSAVLLFVLVSMACNLSLPGLPGMPTATPTATALPLPPAIVETVPPVGSQIALQSPLTIYFSEPMERASVEAAFTSSDASQFLFNWLDDSTLSVTPAQPLPGDAQVSFTLGVGAKTLRNGLTLPREITLAYRTAGLLRLAQVLPAPQAQAVSPASAVVAAFNQPVVPLGADAASQPAGFTLEPAANGRGEWLNTSTYAFYPDPGLAGGADYTIRVNPALKSSAGTPLDASAANLTWAFHTALPEVLSVTPDQARRLDLDAKFEVTFNQPMDRASVESAFALRAPDGSSVPGTFDWNDRGSVVSFTASGGLLARATVYTLTVGADSRSLGGKNIGRDFQVEYATYGRFSFNGANIPDGGVRPTDEGLVLILGAPLNVPQGTDPSTLLRIEPTPSFFSVSPDGEKLAIYGQFDAGQLYTLILPASLADQWGQTLGQEARFTFREPDANPALDYGNYGQELFTRPDDPLISLRAVNINTLILSRGTLSLDDFLRLETDYQFRQSYAPADNTTWLINPNLPLNNNQPVALSLSEGPLTPGLYYINIDSPDLAQKNIYNNTRFLLSSNLNVTVKASATEALVWAVDLRTQTPAANASLRLFDDKGGRIASGQTDSNGLWRAALPEGASAAYAVIGNPGDDLFGIGGAEWHAGINPWDFGLQFDESGPHTVGYLYSDRPVYRPGDTVHFRGVLRSLYDGRYSNTSAASISLHLVSPNSPLADQQVTLSPGGTFSGEFLLPEKAVPGGYNLNIDLGDNGYFPGSNLYFDVADYRKPEINLAVDLQPAQAKNGDQLTGTLHAEYFFGAPVADLPFTWQVYSRSVGFSLPEFNTGLYSSNWLSSGGNLGIPYMNGEGRTDASGNFSIPLNNLKIDDTADLTLEITATESGGLPVSARATATLHPQFLLHRHPPADLGRAGWQCPDL